MNPSNILKKLDLNPSDEDLKFLEYETKKIVGLLSKSIKSSRLKANVFVGGSFAKGTLMRDVGYDVDIFIRFKTEEEEIPEKIDKLIKMAGLDKCGIKKVHGSRDYYQMNIGGKLIIELIPVLDIKDPTHAKNVTDLSFFHVGYVKKELKNTNLANEIRLAKAFCKTAGVYGAESYIQGFSGYALECLIIYFRTFKKMLEKLASLEDKLIIDQKRLYKNKNDILIELNESKIKSPLIVVDPTWKERNVLAALSEESFDKFKKIAKSFLKQPDIIFFENKRNLLEEIRMKAIDNKCEFVELEIETDRQEGDIAGTKLKKFFRNLQEEIKNEYDIIGSEFEYFGDKKGNSYIALKPKKEIIRAGPLVNMKNHVANFKKEHKNTFEKEGRLYAKIELENNAIAFIKDYCKVNKKKMNEMGIISLKII